MKRLVPILLVLVLLLGCVPTGTPVEAVWEAGFGSAELPLPTEDGGPLYIAGYRNGKEITGVLDLQQARALWLSDGRTAMVLIAVDCVGLGSDTVARIRDGLADFCRRTGCDSVNVISTHTHAGVDTLGLWGPVGLNGKNEAFMDILVAGAIRAAEDAYGDRSRGTLQWATTKTEGFQEDSRLPEKYDSNIYQIRFQPEDPNQNGIRLWSFGAHAEALRSENTKVSRDYPGVVCDIIHRETGDDGLFVPGAIGGLIMTPRLKENVGENLQVTGQRIANRVLADTKWTDLTPDLAVSRVEWETELDNTLFMYYKFLGILGNPARQDLLGRYYLTTEVSVVRLGALGLTLVPGELFPELVQGTGKAEDPQGIVALGQAYGLEKMLILGLANDEIGYIVPPSDFVLDEELPYVQEAEGDHYEETNSVGPNCAADLVRALEEALKKLK